MKNAFGGLLNLNRHWTHRSSRDARRPAADPEGDPSRIFAVMDGTIAGEARAARIRPHVKNYILASSDCVAIDAIAAKNGLRPDDGPQSTSASPTRTGWAWDARRRSRSSGRHQGRELPVPGSLQENTFASWGQKLIYWARSSRSRTCSCARRSCRGRISPPGRTTTGTGTRQRDAAREEHPPDPWASSSRTTATASRSSAPNQRITARRATARRPTASTTTK